MLLYGYYGQQNAGDDAFTVIAGRMLRERGHHRIDVNANHLPNVPLPGMHALGIRRRWKGLALRLEQWRTRRALRGGNGIVVAGGSLFRSVAGMRELSSILDQAGDDNHVAIGVSVGPFEDDAAREWASSLLGRFKFVGLRDRPSHARMVDAGLGATAKLTFDLAPLLPAVCPEIDLVAAGRKRSGLGVALCGPDTGEGELAALAAALSRMVADGVVSHLVLLPFNGHPVKGDEVAHERLRGLLDPGVESTTVRYDGDPRRTLTIIAGLQGIIGMRLHAAIFGYIAGTATLVVPYQEKSTAWVEMIGHPADFVAPIGQVTAEQMEALIREPARATPLLPAAEAQRAAMANFGYWSP